MERSSYKQCVNVLNVSIWHRLDYLFVFFFIIIYQIMITCIAHSKSSITYVLWSYSERQWHQNRLRMTPLYAVFQWEAQQTTDCEHGGNFPVQRLTDGYSELFLWNLLSYLLLTSFSAWENRAPLVQQLHCLSTLILRVCQCFSVNQQFPGS